MSLSAQYRKEIEAVIVAAVAGLLGCLMRTLKKGTRIWWPKIVLETLSSGFVGYLALHLCQAQDLSESWTGAIVGLSGWAGAASSIALVERLVYRRLGVPDDVATPTATADTDDTAKPTA
jgi:hypothetical protein